MSKWRSLFLEPMWCVDAAWLAGDQTAETFCCWELWYARIDVHPGLPDELLERVVVHELAELELYEIGRHLEETASRLDETIRQLVLMEHARLRNRMIERKLGRLLPAPRTVAVRTGDSYASTVGIPALIGLAPPTLGEVPAGLLQLRDELRDRRKARTARVAAAEVRSVGTLRG